MEKEVMTEKTARMPHSLTLERRNKAALSGVTAVSCFNEQEIVLETSEGELAILGEGLHIGRLNLEDGRLEVTGNISGLEYSERQSGRERRGLFFRRRK